MTGSFADLVKNARFEELRAEAEPWLDAPWSWDDLLRLLDALGVRDPDGFLAAGWWLPAAVRLDPAGVDAYADRAQQAIEQGIIPQPGSGYTWDDVRALCEWCGIEWPAVVAGLLWAYAQTLGEQTFLDALRRTAPR